MVFVADHRFGACGAVGLDAVGLRIVWAVVVGGWSDDLRDDVSGALDDDAVASPDVFAVDVVFIVEGCLRNGDASDDDGFEHGVGVDGAGAAYVGADFKEVGDGLFGWEFVGGRPSGVSANGSEAVLEGDVVELDDNAVDAEI